MTKTKSWYYQKALKRKLVEYLDNGLEWVILSGQQGVETWAFDVLQELKEIYQVKVALIPPFKDQDHIWKEDKQKKYQTLIQLADYYQPLSQKSYESPKQYFVKNKWFIEKPMGAFFFMKRNLGALRNIL